MKLIVGVLFLFIISCKCSKPIKGGSYTEVQVDDTSGDSIKIKVDTNLMIQDTFYLKRVSENGKIVNKIFIDPNMNSKAYEDVFGLDESDKKNIEDYVKDVKKNHHNFYHLGHIELPTEWRPVVKYHNKYFLYNPSDYAGKATFMLTDSLFMNYFDEGYIPIALASIKKENPKVYKIKTSHLSRLDHYEPDSLNIYEVDKKTRLSVWELRFGSQSKIFLMVPRNTMHYFQIIINTGINKEDEVDFEKIDYQKLLKP